MAEPAVRRGVFKLTTDVTSETTDGNMSAGQGKVCAVVIEVAIPISRIMAL